MYKYLVFCFAIIALTIGTAFAVGEVPKEKVWVDPIGVKTGTAITISTFLYNDQKETMTYTLEAKAGDTSIAKPVITLASGSAKTVAIAWKQPASQTTVTVAIISALNAKRVDLPALHGSLGAVLVGEPEAQTTPSTSTGVFGKALDNSKSFLESFRVKQALFFTNERDMTRAKLGIPNTDATANETPASGVKDEDLLQVKKIDNPMDYGTLVLSTALASFFSSTLMFYGALLLVGFLIVRFFFKMFV